MMYRYCYINKFTKGLYQRKFSSMNFCSKWKNSSKTTKLIKKPCILVTNQFSMKIYSDLIGDVKLFHTTSTRCINPVIVLALRQISKLTAILVGRGFRKWWKSLPDDKKKLFSSHVNRNRWKYLVSLLLVGGTSFYFYQRYVCLTPYTDRKRFMLFDSDQIEKLSNVSFQMDFQEFKDKVLPSTHPHVVRTQRICQKLFLANRDIAEISGKFWTVYVINIPVENCQVYSTGQIVMNSGMLELADNDDQVAIVLAHELSHVILEHSAELFNYATLLDAVILLPLALIWALLPNDGVAAVTNWFFRRVFDTVFSLPYSRLLEAEADALGIFLAASACYDVREASAFWGRLDLIEKFRSLHSQQREVPEVAFLSTHPSHVERQQYLDELMANALQTRDSKKCPRLGKVDPRVSVQVLQQRFESLTDKEKVAMANRNSK